VTDHPGTCDASLDPGVGDPIGPCVLRHGHDGPVHQDARGARWWPREGTVVTASGPLTEEQADALRARWMEHFAEHARNGTISPYSPSRVAEAIDARVSPMAETCTHFSEHGWGRCVEPRDHAPGKHMYRNPSKS
jgi:hypothetical protein